MGMKKSISLRLMGVAAALTATVSAAPAFATDYASFVLNPDTFVPLPGSYLGPSNPKDTYKFTVPVTVDATSGLAVNTKTQIGLKITGLIDATAKFYSGSTANPANIIGTINATQGATDSIDFLSLAGDYFIEVTGTPFSNLGGQYSLSLLSGPAAAAPGPAGFLVVGAGAAAMAFRRRRQKATAVAAMA